LQKAGIKRDGLNIINTINCRPPSNLYPTDAAARSYISDGDGKSVVGHCYKAHVEPLLRSKQWTRIDAVGEKALRTLTGKTDGIMKWRGSPLPLKGEETPRVMPILHPSYLMRDQQMIPATISDLKKGLQVPPEYYNLNPSVEEVDAFQNAKLLTFDIETNRFSGTCTMVGIQIKPYTVTVVPYNGPYIAALKRVFATADAVVGQNIIGFDLPVLKKHGIEIRPTTQIWDIMLMQHLCQPDMPHDLEFISSIFTQKPAWKHLSEENMALYCARDVDVTQQAFSQLRPTLASLNLLDVYNYTQVPLAKICRQLSDTGIKTDGKRLLNIRESVMKEFEELQNSLPKELQPYDKEVKKRAPAPPGTLGKSGKPVKFISVPALEHVVPWQSPKFVEEYLYTTLGLPKQLHAKTKKVSSDKTALDRLTRKYPDMPQLAAIKKVRALDELVSTFLKQDSPVASGHVNASFLVHGTKTGRLSSSHPNMQNIPPKSRYIYVPAHADWCFIEADFSSLENRLAAWYAGDTDRLKRLSVPGFNEHKWLTSQIYGIPEDEVDKDSWQYKRGKNTNHGADGAMGPRKLSQTYDIPEKEARELLLQWRRINAKSAEWQEVTGNKSVKEGFLRNAFGRMRWFWSQSAYTEGIRFLPQSTGADICFRAMIALCYKQIQWPEEFALKVSGVLAPLPHPAQLVLQVHDSLLVQCPSALVPEVVATMNRAMAQPWGELGGFAIPAAFKVGAPNSSWGELQPYNV